jgi:acetolactate synthase-1/2/3 large subunit
MPGPLIQEADVILVVDCDVPWFPNVVKPSPDTVVIQADVDPFYTRYPLRGFPSDLTIQGAPELVLKQIKAGMADQVIRDEKVIEKRRGKLAALHARTVKGWEEAIQGSDDRGIEPNWVSHQVQQVMDDNTFVVNEYGNAMNPHTSQHPGSYFCLPHAGYLGWGLGAALGMKLARPDATIIATVGDGCYLFGVPSACHLVSETYGLPVLIIIYNNRSYFAVKRANRIIHPEGWASRTGRYPLSELPSKARYEKVCEAFGGYGERVESPDQVAQALERALHAVRVEKRQAVLNVICSHP